MEWGEVATVRNWISAATATLIAIHVVSPAAHAASINAGNRAASPTRPFTSTTVAEFDTPWAIAFLPDGRMLITEKPGRIFLVTQSGQKTEVGHVPKVLAAGQNGLLDIVTAPDFASSSQIYFTYVEPGDGGRLTLSRSTLSTSGKDATLTDLKAIWRQTPADGAANLAASSPLIRRTRICF